MKDIDALLIKASAIAGVAVLLSCGGEPTTPSGSTTVTPPPQSEIPITGAAVPGMEAYDQKIPTLMRKYAIPGGAVAVMREGRLIYARGFGYADVESETPVQPDALFRIASVSKPITSVAIMKLVEEGKLALDDRVAPFIAYLTPAPGATVDPRWEQITIRQLLYHAGGWDRMKPNGGFDPMFLPASAAAAVNAPAPASAETIIRYMKGRPLDFDPGTRFVYSNFGYAILGRVIERASGMPTSRGPRCSTPAPTTRASSTARSMPRSGMPSRTSRRFRRTTCSPPSDDGRRVGGQCLRVLLQANRRPNDRPMNAGRTAGAASPVRRFGRRCAWSGSTTSQAEA